MKISILIASRKAGNENSRLNDCINSLIANCSNPENFEILVKYDDDDLERGGPHSSVKSIVTSRALGYEDLHKAYLDLLCIGSPESELFWVLSDDTEVTVKGWDEHLINIAKHNIGKPYVIHVSGQQRLATSAISAIEYCENYPVWSKKWVGLVGGFGYTFSTDGWTSLICYLLRKFFNISPVINIALGLTRHRCQADNPGSERWNGVRHRTIQKMLSPQLQSLLAVTAESIANSIKGVSKMHNPEDAKRFFLLQVTGEEANVIGEALGNMPYAQVAVLIERLQKAIEDQQMLSLAAEKTEDAQTA